MSYQVRTLLTKSEREKFDEIKDHFGLRTDAEAIRLMIKFVHDRIIKE